MRGALNEADRHRRDQNLSLKAARATLTLVLLQE
jgi:hypothetical protein